MAKAKTDIRSLARSHTATAIRTLAGIMEQSSAPPAARVSAAQALLDRGWGKAEQKFSGEVEHKYIARVPVPVQDLDEWQKQANQTLQ